jgi:hypothetical protein
MLKVLIDSYYASTRFTTIEIRKQHANLPIYMQTVARGDVTRLCEQTRKLNAELEASGEKTLDIVANVLAALEKAPYPVFQRWLEGRNNIWALKQIEWQEDASDLMDEAESFYLNLREGRPWKKPHDDRPRAYALKASDASVSSDSTQEDTMESSALKKLKSQIRAFTATEKQLREQKYKWKQVPPKDGESTTKKVLVDGVRKKYYWCVYHKAWTLHSPQECRKSEENRKKRKSPNKHEGYQRGRGHMIRQGLLLKHWPYSLKTIQPHPVAVPTILKTQIRIAISQQPTTAAAVQSHPHKVTRLLNMTLMSPDC